MDGAHGEDCERLHGTMHDRHSQTITNVWHMYAPVTKPFYSSPLHNNAREPSVQHSTLANGVSSSKHHK